ncbi:hypothetical protein Bbelb_092040 [Branchiostoma belcheri]|nr:hypothetical protein Bbelb_092040 [Branchiostoma belcheri]
MKTFRATIILLLLVVPALRASVPCGGILSGSSGQILSPGYGEGLTNSPGEMDCEWKIIAPAGKVLQLTVVYFQLGENDLLEIFDFCPYGHSVQNLTGTAEPPLTIITTANEAFLKFTADGLQPTQGFRINYQAIPPPYIQFGQQNSQGNIRQRREIAGVLKVVSFVSDVLFNIAGFIFDEVDSQQAEQRHQQITDKLDQLNGKIDDIQEEITELGIMEQLRHQRELAADQYADSERRIKNLHDTLRTRLRLTVDGALEPRNLAQEWVQTVLSQDSEGLNQALNNMHDMVMGSTTVFDGTSIIETLDAILREQNHPNSKEKLKNICEYIIDLQLSGYVAWILARKQNNDMNLADEVMKRASKKLSEQSCFMARFFYEWPAGRYGLPKASSGCPGGFRKGQYDFGGHGSSFNWTGQLYLAGRLSNDYVQQGTTSSGSQNWPKGSYCTLKYLNCPVGKYMYIEYNTVHSVSPEVPARPRVGSPDGRRPEGDPIRGRAGAEGFSPGVLGLPGGTQTGVFADGSAEFNSTEVEYCCREDGSASFPIRLPSRPPFYLLRHGGECQQVDGATVREGWVEYRGNGHRDGVTPDDGGDDNSHRLHYCFYSVPRPATNVPSKTPTISAAVPMYTASVANFGTCVVISCVYALFRVGSGNYASIKKENYHRKVRRLGRVRTAEKLRRFRLGEISTCISVLILSTVSGLMADHTCFPTCERKPWRMNECQAIRFLQREREESPPHPLDRKPCLVCHNGPRYPLETAESHADKCFPGEGRLVVKGLWYNALREVQSQWWVGLVALKTLLLAYNKIETIPSKAFEPLTNLKLLDLLHNDLVRLNEEAFSKSHAIATVVLGGNHLVSTSGSLQNMAWKLVRESCAQNAKQLIRLEAVGTVLVMNNESTESRFTIDWSSEPKSKNDYPKACGRLESRLGHFKPYPPFVIIVKNGTEYSNEYFSTLCSNAWEESGGLRLLLEGTSNVTLHVSAFETRKNPGASKEEGASVVVNTSNRTSGGRIHSVSKVNCLALVHNDRNVSFFNVSATRQAGDTKCFEGNDCVNGARNDSFTLTNTKEMLTNTTHHEMTDIRSENVTSFSSINQTSLGNATAGVPVSSLTQSSDVTPDVSYVSNLWILPILMPVGTALGIALLLCYGKRNSGNRDQNRGRNNAFQSPQNSSSGPAGVALSNISTLLQSNPMYSRDAQDTPRTETENIRDPGQADGNSYNQINEDEVYDPSPHHYSNDYDETTGQASHTATTNRRRNQRNEDEVYDPSPHYYSNDKETPGQTSHVPISNTYNQINEDEVYDPSPHYYSNDKETPGQTSHVPISNTYNQINEDEVYDPSPHHYSNDHETLGQQGPNTATTNTYNQINEDELYDSTGHKAFKGNDAKVNSVKSESSPEGRKLVQAEKQQTLPGRRNIA